MHYKNGREAKEGDHVIAKDTCSGRVVGGMVHSLNANSNTCNCQVAVIFPGTVFHLSFSVGELVHVEDALAAMPAVPTTPES